MLGLERRWGETQPTWLDVWFEMTPPTPAVKSNRVPRYGPYCGTNTTCEALWMGAPVVSLAGRTHVSRVGCSLLHAAGLGELSAAEEQQYIEIARAMARNLDRLAALRASLRQQLRQSQLLDAVGFTRRLEAAYRRAWAKRCASTP